MRSEDIPFMVRELHQQFINYYRINGDKMTWSEKLFFNHIERMVEDGFYYAVVEKKDGANSE